MVQVFNDDEHLKIFRGIAHRVEIDKPENQMLFSEKPKKLFLNFCLGHFQVNIDGFQDRQFAGAEGFSKQILEWREVRTR